MYNYQYYYNITLKIWILSSLYGIKGFKMSLLETCEIKIISRNENHVND